MNQSVRAAVLREVEAVAARMPAFGCEDEPLLVRALAALRESAPGDGRLQLCQGDINIFNYLFRGGEVVAVVDWEQAHIGDARSDVGQLVALSHLKGAPFGPAGEASFVQAYQAAAGIELPHMDYFRALWLFELGVIYPNMDRFSTAYEVSFSVPMTTLENTTSKVTLASSLGSADFTFPVKK